LLAEHQCQAVAAKVQFCKGIVFFSGEASFTDGLNLSNAMEGMVDGIACINIDGYFLEFSGKAEGGGECHIDQYLT